MSHTDKEYDDDSNDDLDGLVPPSTTNKNGSFALEYEEDTPFDPKQTNRDRPNKLLFYIATIQAFIIIYRTEVFLGTALVGSIGVAFSSYYKHHHQRVDPFKEAHIQHDYSSEIKSKYDLTLGSIDHWCLRGDDNSCRCEDPLEPMGKRSSRKWEEQHKENMKVATAVLMKLTSASTGSGGGSWNQADYYGAYDEMWLDSVDDDWIYGEGARFGDDDYGYDPFATPGGNNEEVNQDVWADGDDDGYGTPMQSSGANENDAGAEGGGGESRVRRRTEEDEYVLDVVFIGDSITEQRQGTEMGKDKEEYIGIKEVFDKTFSKDKGGEFNGVAMGISGDTAPNLLWRLMNGEMPYGLTPKVWWVGIGINDLSMKGCSEEVVLLGILRVVEEIQNFDSNAIVVINSILPVRRNEAGLLEHTGKHHEHEALKKKEKNLLLNEMDQKRIPDDLWPSIVSINEELDKFASKHPGVKFFNADNVFVDEREDGKYLKLDLMADAVHPNLSGHKKWNNAIKKRLHEILKDQK